MPAGPDANDRTHENSGAHFLIASLIGLAVAAWVFTIPVLLGAGPFWEAPNYPDMQQHLSAARYFINDSWRFPIFLTKLIMPPEGVSVVFLDVNPLLALIDKLLFKTTGLSFNYFGPWIALCFALQCAAFLYLCRTLGARGWIATITSAVIAISIPEFLFRYFHLNLLGQFFITAELALYFDIIRNGRARLLPYALALPLVSLMVHFYLFAMVTGVFAVILLDLFLRRREMRRAVLIYGAGFGVGAIVLFVVSGYLHGAGGSTGFGHFSMNILSPFVPQQSGLFGMSHIIDATGGQYEGFNYLGAGVILLAIVALILYRRDLGRLVSRYRYLAALLAAFTLFAISFAPYAGDFSLLHGRVHHDVGVPPPAATPATAPKAEPDHGIKALIFYPLQQFRSSGRFFWPLGYLIAAAGIAGVCTRLPRRTAGAILAVAAALQFVDAAPLRSAIAHEMRAPTNEPVPAGPWEKLIALHSSITVLPSMDCADVESPFIPMFVFYASASVTPTHSAKLSRGPKADCPAEMTAIPHTEIGPDDVVVLLAPPITPEMAHAIPDFEALCRPMALGFVCSHKWPQIDAAGIVIDPGNGVRPPLPFDARNVGRGP